MLAGASLTGTEHASKGKPCEDAFFIGRDDEGFILVACDGAGSRPNGRTGAQVVASAVGRVILANAQDVIARRLRPDAIIDVAQEAIRGVMTGPRDALDDYATTLVALLVHGNQAMTCHVGDGAIFCLEGNFPRCISPPDRVPGSSTFTTFVTSKGAKPRMWLYEVPDYWTGFLCVTDGAEPALYNQVMNATSPLVTTLVTQFDLDPSRAARQNTLEITCRHLLQPRSEDDITLVGARRLGAGGAWGCPLCHRPLSKVELTRDRSALHGFCRPCCYSAFRQQLPVPVVAERPRLHGPRLG